MTEINYRAELKKLPGDPAFAEASKEELRVLLTLIALEGRADSEESLATSAGVSSARCKSAIAFWEGAGIIQKRIDGGIVEEFEERLVSGELDEEPAVQVAEHIRDENLASMISECASLLGKSDLSSSDVKTLTALNSQCGLSPEYIVTLAAHLASKDSLTIFKLRNKAIRLQEQGCDDLDKLESYIQTLEECRGEEWEYRRVLGLYAGNLSKSQREYFKKWSQDFGYSATIVGEAFDIAVMNTAGGRGDLRYMDAILTSWHEAGCKTLSECKAKIEADRVNRAAEKSKRKQEKSRPETPRYGDFDVNEAFINAIDRSFGKKNED